MYVCMTNIPGGCFTQQIVIHSKGVATTNSVDGSVPCARVGGRAGRWFVYLTASRRVKGPAQGCCSRHLQSITRALRIRVGERTRGFSSMKRTSPFYCFLVKEGAKAQHFMSQLRFQSLREGSKRYKINGRR